MMSGIRMLLWMIVLTGIGYPLCLVAIAHIAWPQKSCGSFLYKDGERIGSRLIGQAFQSEKYLWSRPSINNYQTLPAAGSNLGPTSVRLKEEVKRRRDAYPLDANIPSELLFTSASGVDPDLSLEAAYFQVERIASSRGYSAFHIKHLIAKSLQKRSLGFLGEERVNVLMLNVALDELEKLENSNN